ncbi:zinc finger Y-chromosomal protein 1-like isoform X2 [Coccinella septempunctata]|uniref:zinc finger Y-chromosomal protein 1-like isoform X2 n=1 Tax=Coccinella septempunctata TaxID=41139 RepID=UPI001D08CEDB|nr:zinc finger Y-chromosomal protein 1-like isoform X2 [Coccinella septempunctata]
MVLCDNIENEGKSKSPRYVIINDEIYIEFPEGGNVEDKRLVAQHLLPVPEKNNVNIDVVINDSACKNNTINQPETSSRFPSQNKDSDVHFPFESQPEKFISDRLLSLQCEEDAVVISDDDYHEMESDKSDGQKDAKIASNHSHLEETPQASVMCSYVQKDINKTGTESKKDFSNQGKISNKKKNSTEICTITQRLLYAQDRGIKLRISDHFPINRFNPKNLLPATNTNGYEKDNYMESNTSGKNANSGCPYCNHKSEKRIKRHLLRHMKVCYCQACNDVMSTTTGYSLSHIRSNHRAYLKCAKCLYPVDNEKVLRCHVMSTHKEALLRQCSICGYWLKKASTEDLQLQVLVDHVRKKHSGEKPHCLPWNFVTQLNDRKAYEDIFHCPDCPHMIVTSLTDLLYHLPQHTSEILKKCNFCKFTHHSEIWMKLHMKTHSHIMYKCPYCKYKNSKHFTLKYHIRNRHRKRLLRNKSKNLLTSN